MPASDFDFDVITGPSTPRDSRKDAPHRDDAPVQPAEPAPVAARNTSGLGE